MFMTTKRHEPILAATLEKSRIKGRLAAEALAERNSAWAARDKANAALAQIIALETPSCAHIGKKMAAVARNAVAT